MKTARVAYAGALHEAVPHARGLQLADGRVLAEGDVVWLPPFDVGTVIALGLNYAEHAQELSKELSRETSPGAARAAGAGAATAEEPLVFFKTPGALLGHRGRTRRPRAVTFMHYECELAVIIGRGGRHIAAARAMDHVAGYTIANDYAVRDHLENWLRPNLRAKNRDGATVLGPWFTSADEVEDPHALALATFVNGRLVQQGHTSRMVHRIPALIEHLSGFMTLAPGDVILTGTPEGVSNVVAGDEVACEIEGLGRLVNTLAGDDEFER